MTADGPGPRVLLVEDNPLTRKLLARTLESEGWIIDEAGSGARALAAAAASPPDLVLQDLVLPDMDGLHLATRLRAVPGIATTPLVILSGFTSRFVEAAAHAAGFAAVLPKPIEPDALLARLRALLPTWSPAPRATAPAVVVAAATVAAARALERELRRLGLEVEAVVGGDRALAHAARRPATVLLTELALPDLDGLALCAAAAGAPHRRPVVVLVGDDADDATVDACTTAGAAAVLRWPSAAATVVHAVRAAAGPGAPPPLATAELRAEVLRRELVRERERTRTLTLRTRLHEARLALLAGIANAVTRGDDEATALRDVLAACLDVAAASKGALYLRGADERVGCRAALGYPPHRAADVADFFGHRARFDAALSAGVPVAFGPEQAADRPLLAAAGVHTARLIPLTREAEPIGAIFLGADADHEGLDDAVTFARALGNQVVLSQALQTAFQRVAASEAYHRSLTEQASCGVLTLDGDGRIVTVNPAGRAMLGAAAGCGTPLRALVRAADRAELDRLLHPAPGAPAPAVEVIAPHADGRDRVLELTGTLVDTTGAPLVLVVANDVSDQKRILQQLAFQDKLATVGTLAAGIAHEINNPMTFVLNDLELIETRLRGAGAAQPEVVRQVVQLATEARQGADRIRELVGALKGFTRVDTGDLSAVAVNQLLDDAVHMAGGALRQRATIVRDYREVPPIHASSGRLLQVFTNLLVNAAQAIPEGQGDRNQVTVRTRIQGDRLVVEVADTGTGIAPDDLGRIFEPFFTTKPAGVGTGLGLSICHEIIHHHGGTLEVASELGAGATFTVRLPLATAPAATAAATPAAPAAPPARVLLVDDEALLLRMLARALGSRHDVVTALGGAVALEILARDADTFDLIVTDLCMPDVDGIALEAHVRAQRPALAEHMLFMTGGAITAAARDFVAHRPERMIQKPFTISAMIELIDTTLRDRA